MSEVLTLRDYQDEALARTASAEERGVRRQLGVAATGLGKTIIFAALAQRRGGRTLVLAHRDELVRQAADKLVHVWPDAEVGIVKAGDNEVDAPVVVASVQTVSRPNRLDQLLHDGYEPFGLVVVDEAHHASADTYQFILDALHVGEDAGPLLLGVTATPDRGDGRGLDDIFQEITWAYDMLWGISGGYLCDVRGLRVTVEALDLSNVRTSHGDFVAGQAGQALEDAHAPEAIVAAWRRHASERRTLVFTPTVDTARQCAEHFRRVGVVAAYVHAGTPLEERRSMLRAFSRGDIQVMVNCAVLTEGYDEPRVDCIVVARPTKSRALFTQMIGRGTRRHPDKADLLVLDVVGASDVHSLITVPSLFGVEDDQLAAQLGDGTRNLTDVVGEYEAKKIAVGRMRAEEANLFGKHKRTGVVWLNRSTPQERRYERPMSFRTRDGVYTDLGRVVLVEREGGWLAGMQDPDGTKRVLYFDADLETAQGVAEDAVRSVMGSRSALYDAGAAWRKRKPSERQLEAARKWRLPGRFEYRTAGELSDALDAHIARKLA